jgi:cell division protein FtsW
MARREFVLGWEARALVIITATLVVFGLAAVYSASAVTVESGRPLGSARMWDQALGAVVGTALALVVSRLNLDRLRQLAWPLVGVAALLLLILVLPFTHAIAPPQGGARRWLRLGLSIQVSEIAKLAVVIWTAMLCAKKGAEVRRLRRGLLPVMTIVGPLAFLILIEPDLSVAVTVVFLALVVLFASGARVGHFVLLGAVGLLALRWQIERVEYQFDRIVAFLNPAAAGSGLTYQQTQSLIGVGSGGLVGVGFGHGQQKLGFLPVAYSDFVFATIAEEWGFIGVVLIVALFLAFVVVGLRLARQAGDPFRQLLGVGCVAMIGLDAFQHMAVTVGLVPTTGLVLPFISHGRTGLVIALVATGLLINLGTRRRPALVT